MKRYKIKKPVLIGIITPQGTVDTLVSGGRIQLEGEHVSWVAPNGEVHPTNAVAYAPYDWVARGLLEAEYPTEEKPVKPKLFKIKQPVNVTFVDDTAPFVTLTEGQLLVEGGTVKWISGDKKQTRLVYGLDRRGLDHVFDAWCQAGYIEELLIETAPPAAPVPPTRYTYTAVTQQRGEDFAAFTARLDKLGADGWRVHTLQSDTVFDPYNCEKIIILYALMEKVR